MRGEEDLASPGLIGRASEGKAGRVTDEILAKSCIPPECLPILSRFLEETFRNGVVSIRPPSLSRPPFKFKDVNVFIRNKIIFGGGSFGIGVFQKIVCYRVSLGHRGVVHAVGHAAESAAAFSDLAWRITVNNTPYEPWRDVRIQIWNMAPPTPLPAGIPLREGDQVCIEAASLSPADHTVSAVLCGWEFPVRAECGDEVKSTLVD